jgi:glycosyltransferase involved in cell wall biosynthesis
MHIGLDGLPLTTPKTGVGHYTFELARELATLEPSHGFDLLYPATYPLLSLPDRLTMPSNLKLERVRVGPLGRHWWSAGLPRHIRAQGIELFHGTNYDVPLWRSCATVLTIHDLSPLLHPETQRRRSVQRARRRLPLMLRTADAVITPTESVRRELCEFFKVAPTKIFAIPEAARACFAPMDFAATENVRRRLGVGDEFILAVGTIEPRKNLATLVSAFEEVIRARPASALQLVIAGGAGWLSGPLFEAFSKTPVSDRILLTDYLHDDDLRALYASCRAFIYPSIYEGFGLPPLEAMACGAPVIASSIPALRETTGDAARHFNPKDIGELTKELLGLLGDEHARQNLSIAGRRCAAEFSWEKTARLTWDVYEEALRRFQQKRQRREM